MRDKGVSVVSKDGMVAWLRDAEKKKKRKKKQTRCSREIRGDGYEISGQMERGFDLGAMLTVDEIYHLCLLFLTTTRWLLV